MSIIDELYDLTEPTFQTPAEARALQPQVPYLDVIIKAFAPDFLDDFLGASADYQEIRQKECFTRGFRLDAGLALELTAPGPPAPDSRHSSSAGQPAGRPT